jgi:retron-type reverse transcriptase
MFVQNLFQAYFDCRRRKRKTANALGFEVDYESRLLALADDIRNRTYSVGPSIAFIVERPVKREIFAGDFRDRVVHHFIVNELEPILERTFVHDSYACRKGKGTLFGIRRMERFARSVTDLHTREAYVLKLDVSGFFMSIDRGILLAMIERIIAQKYRGDHSETLRFLVRAVLGNDPTAKLHRKRRPTWLGRASPVEEPVFRSRRHRASHRQPHEPGVREPLPPPARRIRQKRTPHPVLRPVR